MWPFSLLDQTHMSPTRLIQRLLRRPASTSSRSFRRSNVIPPPQPWGQAAAPWWQLWERLQRKARRAPSSGDSRLADAVTAFQRVAACLNAGDASDFRLRVSAARSLRELWHLRPELFYLLAKHRNESEADALLKTLDGHFPVRVQVAARHANDDVSIPHTPR